MEQPSPAPASFPSPSVPTSPATTVTAGGAPVPQTSRRLPELPGYTLEGELGRGGMGVVYRAWDLRLKRAVALKMILAGGHASAEQVARLRTEAEAVARLQHPHIVQVYEVGEHEGLTFCALELVGGGNLAQKLHGQPLDPRAAAVLVRQLAEGVHLAHSRNIVHRDLKPANVLLTNEGTPKIADFGLARQLDSDGGQTRTGVILGTPDYMAPEQAVGQGHAAGPAADVWALGAILYECLTGRPPFRAATPLETLERVVGRDPAPPRSLNPKVPRDLETVCLKCLRKQPEKRYASALALAEDLRRFDEGRPVTARPVGGPQRAWMWARRRPALAALLLLALGLLGALLGGGLAYNARLGWYAAQLEDTNAELASSNEQLKKATTTAQGNERAAVTARADAERERDASRLRLAFHYLDEGLALCRRGDVAQGLHWMLRSHETAPPGADDLRRAVRANLSAWWPELHTLQALLPHPSSVRCGAFSPDGRLVLTSAQDGYLRVWDARTGRPLGAALKHEGPVWSFNLSRDGKTVAVSASAHERGAGQVVFWDLEKRAAKRPPLSLGRSAPAIALSSDGKHLLTVSHDLQEVRRWDLATGTSRLWQRPREKPRGVVPGPDARHFVAVGEDRVSVWDLETGQSLATLPVPGVRTALLSADLRLLATSTSRDVQVWDVSKGRTVGPRLPNQTGSAALAFSPNGKALAVSGEDRGARVWEVSSGTLLGSFLHTQGYLAALALSPDGSTLLAGGQDTTGRLFRLAAACPELPPCTGPIKDSMHAQLSPDRKLLVLAVSRQVWFLDVRTGKALERVIESAQPIVFLQFHPRGKVLLTCDSQRVVRFWDVATGRPVAAPVASKAVPSRPFSPDGRWLALPDPTGTAVRLWEVGADGTRRGGDLLPHFAEVSGTEFSPTGAILMTSTARGELLFWDVLSRKQVGARMLLPGRFLRGSFDAGGKRLLAYSEHNTARVWEVPTGRPLTPPLAHQGTVMSSAFSPDGRLVVTGTQDRLVRFWDTATGRPVGSPLSHSSAVVQIQFSPDGRELLVMTDRDIRRWDVTTRRAIGPELRPPASVTSPYPQWGVFFAPDALDVIEVFELGRVLTRAFPPAAQESLEQLRLRLERDSGITLAADGTIEGLPPQAWHRCREEYARRYEGAPKPALVLDPAWKPAAEEDQRLIESAGGMLADRFAFCQTLPLKELRPLLERLRPCGYRPLRIRPWQDAKGLRVAVVWGRDGQPWRAEIGLPAAALLELHRRQAGDGFAVVDAAGWLAGEAHYLAVWAKLGLPAKDVALVLGLSGAGERQAFDRFIAGGWACVGRQFFASRDSSPLHCLVWQRKTHDWHSWWGDRDFYESRGGKGLMQTDLCIARMVEGGPSLRYGGCWQERPVPFSVSLHGLSPEKHRERCRELTDRGYLPAAIGVALGPNGKSAEAGSVWHWSPAGW